MKVATTFILDSLTVYAVNDESESADYIRYTMEDTSLFYGFALLPKVLSHQMYMETEVTGKNKKVRSGNYINNMSETHAEYRKLLQ